MLSTTQTTTNLNNLLLTIDRLKLNFDQELERLQKLYKNEKNTQKAKQILHQANKSYNQYEAILITIEKQLDKLNVQTINN